nr:hypothetical protein [Tanacetum cinerariifolium]
VESYQKKLNLTKPDTYHFDPKHKEAYTAYSNPRGFIYQNKDKQNRLMRIGELHKFSDGTLNDVRTALDNRLKGIQMKYLPQAIWRKSDKERAATMIQAIDKPLKTKMIMRSLEKFVVKVAVQIQSDRLRDEAQAENEEFLKNLDENIQKIIKEQVKEQVKVQVSKILPKIEQTVNEQLEAEVLAQSSNSSKTSYAVAADLTKMELKNILIEKMKVNKSIHRSDEQRNLYKALVEAYESDKIILDTYEDVVTLKRRRDDDANKDKESSVGSDRGSKRRREGKEPESTSAPKEKATRTTSKSTQGSKSRQTFASESAIAEEPMHTTYDLEEPSHSEFKTGAADDQLIAETSQHPEWFSQQKKLPTPDCDWNKTLSATHGSIQPESARDVYSKRKIIAVTELKIVEWHNYKHLDWITVRRDDDKLYKLKEGDFKRLRIQDIEDIMFTRSIVIQRSVEDLQLGVESYHKKLNLTRPDTYRSDLKRNEAYTAYSNPRGFIYQNKDMQNRLMRINELDKFSDGTLTDVCTALDDLLKGIQMKYLPQTIWRKSDKERAALMIQAIDKQLKMIRIMRSLERFVGGRLYEGDFRIRQRTI